MTLFSLLRPCATLIAVACFTALPSLAQTPTEMTDSTIERVDTLPKPKITARVVIETNHGSILVGLYDDTPLHRNNFLQNVGEKAYDSTAFHRVIQNFMIQGGGLNRDHLYGAEMRTHRRSHTIASEIHPHLYHKRGALAAARMGDDINPERHSSGIEFYIVWGDFTMRSTLERMEQETARITGKPFRFSMEQILQYMNKGGAPHLDGQYTVFGEVLQGMDIVEKIQLLPTQEDGRPYEEVLILRTYMID